ncbi:unnamed protein product [Phytophthora fragariaefolia]|uniref:Unnamed protein product n=1 Tax=Phytophthora fragariaefolia TaxID=1490495 RepID=A0A9W7D102_9STRA|nr:unnamed protein product [Phytophthora fragariaefolia]
MHIRLRLGQLGNPVKGVIQALDRFAGKSDRLLLAWCLARHPHDEADQRGRLRNRRYIDVSQSYKWSRRADCEAPCRLPPRNADAKFEEHAENDWRGCKFLSDVWQNISREHLLGCQLLLFGRSLTYRLPKAGSRHDGLAIAQEMVAILKRAISEGWNIGAVVTGNAGQCGRALRILALRWPKVTFLFCFAHCINNIVKAVLKSTFATVAKQETAAVKQLNASSSKWLVRAQINMRQCYGKRLALFTLCETRWNNMQSCFASLLRVRTSLEMLGNMYRGQKDFPAALQVLSDPTFWNNLSEAEHVIAPLSEASYRLQRDENTLSDVVLSFRQIFLGFSDGPLEYKHELTKCIETRWEQCEQPLFMLTFLLNPATADEARGLIGKTDERRRVAEVEERLLDGVLDDELRVVQKRKIQDSKDAAKIASSTQMGKFAVYYYRRFIDDDFDCIRGDIMEWIDNTLTSIRLEEFRNNKVKFWRHIKKEHPSSVLPDLAIKLLSVAVNTATTERLFSEMGMIHSPRRNKITILKAHDTQCIRQRVPSPPSKPSGPVSGNTPPDTEVGKMTGYQAISVDRATALQTLGLLPSGQGSSSGMPVVVEIPPGNITVRVVGVPSTEIHNDGRTFLQDGFGGLEAIVQMESLGATELAVLYEFFDDNDVIGDFILTPRETPLTATELSSQLKNFAVKRDFASILSHFDSKQLALRTFGTVSLLRKVAAKYNRIKRKLAEDDGAASVIELQDEVLRLKRDQQFHHVQTLKMELETARASRRAPTSRSQGPRLQAAHVMNFLHDHATVMMNWPRLRDLLGHLEFGTQAPPEWQTVITTMANDNLAFQAPPFVRMDPPQDEDDEETKESDSPAPDPFLNLSGGASTTKFGSKSSQLGKRASGSQSPKSHKKPASDDVQELPSEWVGSMSPCRPEEVPLPLSPAQARASLADYPVVWKDLRRDVKVLMEDRLDSAPWAKYAPRRYFTVASVVLEGLRQTGTHIPEWRVTPGPSLDDGEIDLLESEDEAEYKAEKDEDYNPHQDLDDGVGDEDDDPDETSDDGVLNVAQRTTKRRRQSQSSAEVPTPKKLKAKSPVKMKVMVGSSGKSKSESGSSRRPKSKSGGSRRRNTSTATVLAVKAPQHLDAEECRVIETPGLGITSWMYLGVRMKPGDPTTHAPFQTQGFPDFVPNRHDFDILKERCDGEELKAFLATCPWTKLSDTRCTEFFFHRRADLGHEVVRALEDCVDFMEENVEALWHATEWIVLDRDSSFKFIQKTSVRCLKPYESVRKKVITREKQLKKIAPASVWNEPGLWKFPKRICYWVLMSRSHTKPGTDANYSLKEQVELLDAREPARLQWGVCSLDEERIAHLPEDVRAS